MIRKHIGGLMTVRGRALFVSAVLVASVAALTVASPALAAFEGEFTTFEECPLGNAEVTLCIHAKSESGSFTIGKRTVPIKNPVLLQGGIEEPEELNQKFVGAKTESNTLSKTAEPVPGGLLGIVAPEYLNKEQKEKFEEAINKGPTGVNATVELAAPASAIFISEALMEIEEGPGLVLPVKVHLENAFLGSNCYIGSNSEPMVIELTTGTSGTLRGRFASEPPFFTEDGDILHIVGNKLVNQTFKAPGANGCGDLKIVEKIVDEAVDAELGIPSASGTNSATLEGTILQAAAKTVRKHE